MATNIEPVDAFRYPDRLLPRRHGPGGYSAIRSYRPWLRDEFAFRCVYCLVREKWGRITAEFDLDHFLPQVMYPGRAVAYENLVYACRTCNLRKRAALLPGTARSLTSHSMRVYPDGTIVGLTPDVAKVIRVLCLNSPRFRQWRRTWIRIVEIAAEHDRELLKTLLGFPDDLPDLTLCRAPDNTRPEGIAESFFARRQRGELPELYLGS